MKKTTTDDSQDTMIEVVEAPPKTEAEEAVDALNEALRVGLNNALVKLIKDEDGDPWVDVIPLSTYTLGSVDLLVCKAKVTATCYVTDMKNLSTLVLTSMKTTLLNDTDKYGKLTSKSRTVTGVIDVSAKLSKDLTALAGGSFAGSCGGIKAKVGLTGKATAKTVTATSKADFVASLGRPKSSLKILKLSNFSLNYRNIVVDVNNDGDGSLDSKVTEWVADVNKKYGDKLKTLLSDYLEKLLNDWIAEQMPLTIDVNTGKRI